jgi:hypothetical protein
VSLPAFDFELLTVRPSPPARTAEAPRPDRSALLRVAGAVAEAVNLHCDRCPTCDRFDFTTDEPLAPLCREGAALHARYRAARRAALGEAK